MDALYEQFPRVFLYIILEKKKLHELFYELHPGAEAVNLCLAIEYVESYHNKPKGSVSYLLNLGIHYSVSLF